MTDPNLVKIQERIKHIIEKRTQLVIKTSKINSELEKYLLSVISEILKKHDQIRFVEMLYTIVKELAINAIKANQKRIFFEDEGLDIMNPEQYNQGIVKFKGRISDSMAEEYGLKCQQRGVYVQIEFSYDSTGTMVEVINNTPVIKEEEVRLREKLKKAMGYSDIAAFYMDNMDNTEGAGLGIALTMILMKSENIDPNLFRIITKPDKTIARIEVPFSSDYITKRNRQNGESK